MSITVGQTYTAVAANITSSFQGIGGTAPYVYSVLPNGAGGTINSSTGVYTAPAQASSSPNYAYDVIQVTDASSSTGTARILVGTPFVLFLDILQTQLGLDNNHIFEWDQKIFQPTDSGLYVIVSVVSCKPFGNNSRQINNGTMLQSYVNMYNTLGIDIISRGPAARDQKELVILALKSIYSEQQQEANSFYIGKISQNFINLSNVDGAAIPYRFHIDVGFQYTVSTITTYPYFDSFQTDELYLNP